MSMLKPKKMKIEMKDLPWEVKVPVYFFWIKWIVAIILLMIIAMGVLI